MDGELLRRYYGCGYEECSDEVWSGKGFEESVSGVGRNLEMFVFCGVRYYRFYYVRSSVVSVYLSFFLLSCKFCDRRDRVFLFIILVFSTMFGI